MLQNTSVYYRKITAKKCTWNCGYWLLLRRGVVIWRVQLGLTLCNFILFDSHTEKYIHHYLCNFFNEKKRELKQTLDYLPPRVMKLIRETWKSLKCWFEFLTGRWPSTLLPNQMVFFLPTKNTLSISGNVADWIAAAAEGLLCILKQPWKKNSKKFPVASSSFEARLEPITHGSLGLHIILPLFSAVGLWPLFLASPPPQPLSVRKLPAKTVKAEAEGASVQS